MINMPIPSHVPVYENPDRFQDKAKNLVEIAYGIPEGELYIVWFAKTLQNWKALVSTDVEPGSYFEVTYNGDKKEAYVDTYRKVSNIAIPDSE